MDGRFPHMSESLPQLATPAEVAEYLRRAEATVVRDCRKGWLKPAAVKVGGRWLIHLGRLAEMIDGLGVDGGSPGGADLPRQR